MANRTFPRKKVHAATACLFVFVLANSLVSVFSATAAHAADSFNTTLSMPSNNLGLVAHWTFDGPTISGASVADVSGQGNTGTLEYSPPPVAGVEGQALSLNGSNQYVNCGTNNPTFNFASTSSFTESVWAYPTRVNGNWQAVFQVGRNLGLGNYQGIWLSGSNQWVFGSAGGGNLGTVYATPDKWVNITVVHTATSKAIYINGVLNAASGGDAIAGDLGGALCGIGSWGAEYFAGHVDDVRVYNRTLSPYEIKQLYNAGTATHQNATIDPPDLQQGLVGHWTFDGQTISGTTVTDISGNGNNGTMVGGPTSAAGVIGQALSFNGTNQYMNVPTSASLSFAGSKSITISGWVKFSAFPTVTCKGAVIAAKGADSTAGFYALEMGDTGSCGASTGVEFLKFIFRDSSGNFYGGQPSVSLTTGKWYFVTGTYNGTDITDYVDGAPIGVYAATAAIGGTANNLSIGANIANSTNYQYFVDGALDDVRIYDRALPAAQITQLYDLGLGSHQNATVNPPNLQSGLVGHWTFDGPSISGTTVKDVSGGGNNGTMVNSPTPVPGVLGQALSFNGTNQYVNLGTGLGETGSFSVSAWAYPTSVIGSVPHSVVERGLSAPNYEQNYDLDQWDVANNTPDKWRFQINQTCSGGCQQTYVQGPAVVLDKWVLVTETYVSSTKLMSLYIDGALYGTATYAYSVPNISAYTYVGAYPNGSGAINYGADHVDDVRIYNRALSAQEVQQLYNLGR